MKKCMICGNEAPADAPFGFGFSVTGLLRRERDPLLIGDQLCSKRLGGFTS